MANLRRNHHKGSGGISKFLVILLILGVLIFFLLYKGRHYINAIFETVNTSSNVVNPDEDYFIEGNRHDTLLYLPSYTGELLIHDHFALSFKPEYKQAEWAAWTITKAALRLPNQKRKTFFTEDPKLTSTELGPFAYRGSGYQRGHLVPAADVAFDTAAIAQTHYMTNMAPQKRAFNNGIWRELEQLSREWAWKYEEIHVVTGPIFLEPIQFMKSGVAIPNSFYRVLLAETKGKKHSIGFIIANDLSERSIHEYATTVDEVERITKIDFFFGLFSAGEEQSVESNYNSELWPVNENAFILRSTKWNFE
jgi:endonuclease G, mitochondrial